METVNKAKKVAAIRKCIKIHKTCKKTLLSSAIAIKNMKKIRVCGKGQLKNICKK